MGLLSWLTKSGRSGGFEETDIASPEHKANPYPFFARLRADEPVHRMTLRGGKSAWLVTRYDDVAAVLKDDRIVKDKHTQAGKQPWMPAMFRPLSQNMLDRDPPDHTRLRGLVQKAFTLRLVEKLRPRIQSLADGLLDGLRGRHQFDLIRDYALPIPSTVIAEMLGVPAADMHRFHRWSQAIVAADPNGPVVNTLLLVPPVWAFLRYIRRLIQSKRATPSDDLLSALVRVEEAGEHFGEDELIAMSFLLLVAGHETTVNLIGNGMLALLEHPEELLRLRNDPTLIKSAVEELLRYGSPVETATERFAREDVTVAGVTIPRGAQVFASIASANRDERQFPDPDRLDVSREPNRHLAFGLGRHFCLGAALARLEGQIAIATLLQRATSIGLTAPVRDLRWRRGMILRGLKSLPIEVKAWA